MGYHSNLFTIKQWSWEVHALRACGFACAGRAACFVCNEGKLMKGWRLLLSTSLPLPSGLFRKVLWPPLPFPPFPMEGSWNKLTGLFCISFLKQLTKFVPFGELLKYPIEFMGEVTVSLSYVVGLLVTLSSFLHFLFYLLSWRGKVVVWEYWWAFLCPVLVQTWIGCFLLPLLSHALFPTYF